MRNDHTPQQPHHGLSEQGDPERKRDCEKGKEALELDLLGLAEVAELLNLSKGALGERRRRTYRPGDALPSFPRPLVTLRCGPVWARSDIQAYEAECERLSRLSPYQRLHGEDAVDPIDEILARVRIPTGDWR